MKFNLYINQLKAIELGITNINQAHIFDLLSICSVWAKTEIIEDEVYYWIARQKIATELELLSLKPDTIYRHLKSLHALELIDYQKKGKKDCIRITEKGKTYHSNTMSEINPSKVGNKSENNSEINPTYTTTIPNTTTNDTLYAEVASLWNTFATKHGKGKIVKLSTTRKNKINKRKNDFKDFVACVKIGLDKASNSKFLLGKDFFSFDWIIENDNNLLKILEDKYKDSAESWTDA